ncbi:MAG: PQQ-binding-like beta-propeller repeat protein [Halanaerobacter sp.]
MLKRKKVVKITLIMLLLLLSSACNKADHKLKMLSSQGQGEVKVVSSSEEKYQVGTEVVLNAQADEGWKFESWGGSIEGDTNPKTVVIEEDLQVKANFVQTRAMAGGGLDNKGVYHSQNIAKGVDLLWTSQQDYQISSSPLVVDNTLYLGTKKQKLVALNSQTGEQKWEFDAQARIISTPAVEQDKVYFGTAVQGAEEGNFYALDAESGQKLWQLKIPGGIYYSAPKIEDEVLYFGDKKGNLYAVQAKTGEELWKFEAASSIMYSSPAVSEETIIVGTVDGELYAINKEDGKQKWRSKMEHPIVSQPVLKDNRIYYVSYRQNTGLLSAVDKETGSQEWEVQFDGPSPYSIALEGNSAYVGTLAGKLYAIDLSNQEKEWSFTTGGEVIAAPILTEDIVYVGDTEGSLYGIKRQSGEKEWVFEGEDTIVSAPVISQQRLYFSDQTGTLYALKQLSAEKEAK